MEIFPLDPAHAEPAGALVVRDCRALIADQLSGAYAAELADVAGRLDRSEVLAATVDGDLTFASSVKGA